MITCVEAELRKIKDTILCTPGNLDLHVNDTVIIETANGLEVGVIKKGERVPRRDEKIEGKVIRLLTETDKKRLLENEEKAKEAHELILKKIKEFKLPMKLIHVEYTFDRSKIFIYYTSETRVDFRELIKELNYLLHVKIQMVQISVREALQIFGGMGICGREICCCIFLKDFKTCTIEMAKEQNIPLNVAKITGPCGRLICCLHYEYEMYKELRKEFPSIGEVVEVPAAETPDNTTGTKKYKGKVIAISLLKEEITIQLENNEIKKVPLSEIK